MYTWFTRLFVLSLLGSLTAYAGTTSATATHGHKICIHQSANHVALDSTVQGIIDTLTKENAVVESQNIHVESAQGNAVMASQIASKFSAQNPACVFAIGTVSALSLLKFVNNNQAKVVFASVTDPLASGIVQDLKCRTHAIAGVSNYVDLAPQIDMMKKFQPTLKKLGVLYNSGEPNSVRIIALLKEVCQTKGIELVEQTVTKTSELAQAATQLAQKTDAIFISNDNTCLSGFQSIVQACKLVHKPIYCSDTDQVKKGALAALGPNQYQVGVQAAKMCIRSIQGEALNEMMCEFPNAVELFVNQSVAKQLNIEIPKELRNSAVIVD